MKKLIVSFLVPLLLLCGCNKQDSVTYSGMEAGSISSGVFTSDNGTKMTVAGNENKLDVTSARRVLISYKTHPITDSAHIDIDLLGLMDADILEPQHVPSLEDLPLEDAVEVSDAWFSGGYLNLLVSVAGKAANDDQHPCSVAYQADENGIGLRLLHQSSEQIPSGSTDRLNAFLSVPMDETVLSYDHACQAVGKKAAFPVQVLLQWTDYVLEGGPLSIFERKGSYTPPASN